ncbi:PEP/pyruvate-binding domain-containing protein [Desulfolutivibrio sp.]|uniref:PEP/pyruvate-binding domain-containing protein n=1 Tax=Desulfolutivibrio sp. TaxID=2773296 RepID=UPI002F964BD1
MFQKIKTLFRGLLTKPEADTASGLSDEDIQAEFKKRYHHFKLLLTANKKALEVMSQMEQALHGGSVFGMSFIRSHSTAVSVNVYKIIEHLNNIAPEKYAALYPRMKDIQRQVAAVLDNIAPPPAMELTLPLSCINRDMADQVGGKMAGIGEIMSRTGLPVPPGFVITTLAYRRLIEHNDLRDEINRLLQSAGPDDQENLLALSSRIRNLIAMAEVPGDVAGAIHAAYAALCAEAGEGACVSLRSSALGEDAAGQTFAGQFATKLNVAADDLLESYKEVVASKYSPQAMTYRLNRGIPDEDIAMCVGCMAMVRAAAGGVIYSRNPLDIRDDSIFVHSSWGLPKTVVDGSVACDEFVVSREGGLALSDRRIRSKDRVFVCHEGEGVCVMETLLEKRDQPSLDDGTALRLAEAAVTLEEMYGSPVDIEWAVDAQGRLYFLQCRHLTQMEVQGGGPAAKRTTQGVIIGGGATASPGVACGPVFVVRREADLLQFPSGAVLVSLEAPPRWASVINKTAAIVTEKGGSAGHLANVAREFQVPAIMAVPGALAALQNGMEVTVDADGLAVYRGRVEEVLAHARPRKAPEGQTPMHAILRRVMDHITPLHLLDPNDAMVFRPDKCRTLHDITRFCHEKSVTEMFHFGQDFHFAKRAAKQLRYKKTAMKWWFINLDDGFAHDIPGRFVTLEEISSIPVHALWTGFLAIPWQGPPPVDAKGFMSILVRAASNPNLEESGQSAFSERNFFMISRHYMCLSSRFGFHFCTVEALVDNRPQENYVSFQFKGGAAEFMRRRLRAEFVAGILEDHGFLIDINEDSVFARRSGGTPEEMDEALRIVGYLLMHTRQLDMIMHNRPLVETYRRRIDGEIARVLAELTSPVPDPGA